MTRITWILVAAAVVLALAAARCSTGLRADPPVRTID
jgi:hypothetical protein